MSDITAAVNAGYTVTTHESPINVPGWTGSGYIIADEHGNGAYLISGGQNGAFAMFLGMAGGYLSLILEKVQSLKILFERITIVSAFISMISTIQNLYEKCGNTQKYYLAAILSVVFTALAAILSMVVVSALTGVGVILGALLFFTMSLLIESLLFDILNQISKICYFRVLSKRYNV